MRDNFIQNMITVLNEYGFKQDDQEFKRIEFRQQPGQSIIINGQRMDQPPQNIEIVKLFTIIGDGYVENGDGSNRKDFTQINFKVFVENEEQGSFEEGFYWDDFEYFKNVIKQLIEL